MKTRNSMFMFVFFFIFLIINFSSVHAALDPSDPGCNAPSFYTTGSQPPNILFVVDKSGSMGWNAYNSNAYKGDEEGYFDPAKIYKYDNGDSTWKEQERYDSIHRPNLPNVTMVTAPSDSNDKCPTSRNNVTNYRTGSNGDGDYTFKGSCLNLHYMKRIDIERWALTGGTPKACGGVTDVDCDPGHPSSGAIIGGKIVLKPYVSSYGYVEVPEDRIDGFIQAAEKFTDPPRMGVLFYDSDLENDKVYLGDYPNANNADGSYPFTYLKRFLNAKGAGGGTGTYYGLQEAFDYFKQHNDTNVPGYDFSIGAGTYKDPMYRCEANKSNCEAAGWCAKNYVILVSDGQWNTPNCRYTDDPVQPAYNMHTQALRTISGHGISVEKVYTLGVFMGGTGVKSMRNIAMFGSFDLSANPAPIWPGGVTGFPTASCSVDDCGSGSGSSCQDVPSPTFTDWDSTENGDPDTFFAPQNALALKLNLFSIFQDIISDVGASASVATVTQDLLGEDVVIRGAFRNNPPDLKIWEGHLEAYWPVPDCLGASQAECTDPCTWDADIGECLPYTFQYPDNQANNRFCSDDDFHGGHCWDAYLTLFDPDARTLFTYINGVKIEITTDNTANLHPYLANTIDFDDDNDTDEDDTRQLIRWIRGEWDSSWSAEVRRKSGMLGDIVYSAPVVVGAPSLSSVPEQIAVESCRDLSPCADNIAADTCWADDANKCTWDSAGYCKGAVCASWSDVGGCATQPTCAWDIITGKCEQKTMADLCSTDAADTCFFTYRYCNQYRKKVVYVGANDGMLHAFVVGKYNIIDEKWIYDPAVESEVGDELWAFIPSNLLADMSCLAKSDYGDTGGCQHRTMVDLSSMVWDVTLDASTGECSGTPTTVCDDFAADGTGCINSGCTWACTGDYDCSGLLYADCGAADGCEQECTGTLDCTLLGNADCNNVSDCTWGCAEGTDSCGDNTDFSSCDASSNCDWNCAGGSFVCSDITDNTLCEEAGCSLDGCYWENNRCEGTYDCSSLNQGDCNNSWLCNWESEEECAGSVTCADITSRSTCRNRGCAWNEQCEGDVICSSISSRSICRNRGCNWVGNRRSGSCEEGAGAPTCSGFSQSKCNITPGCSYEKECSGSPSCGTLRESTCNNTSGCSWDVVSTECQNRRDCSDIWNRGNCNGYSFGCTGGTLDCSTLSGTETCDSVGSCSGACEGPCCTGTSACSVTNCFTDCTQACNNSAAGNTGVCSPDNCEDDCTTTCTGTLTCDDITSESSCGAIQGCDWTTGTSSPWRTALVGGERGGGDLYFALDLTDPDAPSLLWEYSVLRNMVHLQKTAANTYKAVAPYRDKAIYDELKVQPLSWAVPYVGKFNLPDNLYFKAEASILYPWSPACVTLTSEATCTNTSDCTWDGGSSTCGSASLSPVNWGDSSHVLPGWFAFIGGGIHMYDEDKLLDACSSYTLAGDCNDASARCAWDGSTCSALQGDDIRDHLYEPFFLMLDMKSGTNIFQYTWPMMQQAFKSKWPSEEVDGKQIPHAMSTPVVLDMWNHQWWPRFCANFTQYKDDTDGNPTTDELCSTINGCTWSSTNSKCEKTTCSTLTTEDECGQTSGCIWDGSICNEKPYFGRDGELDHIFMGDMAGGLWGMRFSNATSDSQRLVVDKWETKKSVSNCAGQTSQSDCENNGCWWDTTCKDGFGYRGSKQPLTVTPVAAFDIYENLRLYFGTGKFDDTVGDFSDRNDPAKMSFYSITLPLNQYVANDDTVCTVTDISGFSGLTINCGTADTIKVENASATALVDLNIRLRSTDCSADCTGTTDNWLDPPDPDDTDCRAEYVGADRPDDCDAAETYDCSPSCYSCILDLPGAGERVTTSALVAGELVFFTTFVPQTEACSGGGSGYLYIVDYMCRPLAENPFIGSGLDSEWLGADWDGSTFDPDANSSGGFRANLGSGMPSRPVLDSSGERVIIQTSDAEIHRIKVKMPQKPFYLQGWREQ